MFLPCSHRMKSIRIAVISTLGISLATVWYLSWLRTVCERKKLTDASFTMIVQSQESIQLRGKTITYAYKQHPTSKLLVVFLHGLGGNMLQFYSQFDFCSHHYNVLAMDYVGHGTSEKSNIDADYQCESIVKDVIHVMDLFKERHQNLLLVAHSFGACIAAKVTLLIDIKGCLMLGPKSKFEPHDFKVRKTVTGMADYVLDTLRFFDRWGGNYSQSVNRAVGPFASEAMRSLQFGFNKMTSTPVIKKMLAGVGGEFDTVSPVDPNITDIKEWTKLGEHQVIILPVGHTIPIECAQEVNQLIVKMADGTF